jgi:hypothetical protein
MAERKEGAPDGGNNGSRGGGDKMQGGKAAGPIVVAQLWLSLLWSSSWRGGVEAPEEGMCSRCSVFDFVFSVLRTWDSMRKKQAKKAHHL